MLDIDFTQPGIAILTPRGTLKTEDLARLTTEIDGYVNERDRIPNLVIVADDLRGWDGLAALLEHLQFVRRHHRLVEKVAIVGESLALNALPFLADHLVAAKVRPFPLSKLDDAIEWAGAEKDHPGRFEPIEGLPGDVLAVEAVGIITAQDYRDVLVPLVEEKLKVHDRLKVLVVVGERFTSYSEDAAWDDLRFGLGNWSSFSKIALVTDRGWLRNATRVFAPLMKADVRVFAIDEREEAQAWIRT